MDFEYSLTQVETLYAAFKGRLTPQERDIVEGYLKKNTLKEIGRPHNLQPMKVKYLYNNAVSKLLK